MMTEHMSQTWSYKNSTITGQPFAWRFGESLVFFLKDELSGRDIICQDQICFNRH